MQICQTCIVTCPEANQQGSYATRKAKLVTIVRLIKPTTRLLSIVQVSSRFLWNVLTKEYRVTGENDHWQVRTTRDRWERPVTGENDHYLETGDSKLCDQLDHLRIVIDLHQFTELIVRLEPRQQATELVIIACIWQTLYTHRLTYSSSTIYPTQLGLLLNIFSAVWTATFTL